MPIVECQMDETSSPKTYFAAAERAAEEDLRQCIAKIANNPLVDIAMTAFGGWVAVLNQHRQILAVNHTFLEALGLHDPEAALGLRPGEAVDCIHAEDHPEGCGTSRFCSTCGAVIAIVAAQETGQTQERMCVLSTGKSDTPVDRIFVVRCSPLHLAGEELLVVCMRDVSDEQRRMALERTFLHDVSTVITALSGSAQMVGRSSSARQAELLATIQELSDVLIREVSMQRFLCEEDAGELDVRDDQVLPSEVLSRIERILTDRAADFGQSLIVEVPCCESTLRTDVGLLIRVLVNMVINGFEAGGEGDSVKVAADTVGENVRFRVWNKQPIPEKVAMRVFQRYFSTKSEGGRGMGTFSMKLIGESLLKGEVSFTTSQEGGTVFELSLPYGTDHKTC